MNYRFEAFFVDVADRQLWRGDARLDLTARYFDALVLLLEERGKLVEKERFFELVWGDVVVTDSALTQCIKDIRRQLGDDASSPRYIETVPRYGYRFIGQVELVPAGEPRRTGLTETKESPAMTSASEASPPRIAQGPRWWDFAERGAAGTIGGGIAGALGGLLYGTALAYGPEDAGLGTASILVVLLSLNVFVGLAGGFGVSFGMASGVRSGPPLPSGPEASTGALRSDWPMVTTSSSEPSFLSR